MEKTDYNPIGKVLPLLAEATNEYLLQRAEEEKKEYRGHFRMSSLGQCHRKRIWDKRGEELTNPRNVTNIKRTESGEWLHNFYYNVWEKATSLSENLKLKNTEERVEIPEFNLVGHLDAEFEAITDNEIFNILVDIKSQSIDAFRYYKKEGTTSKPHQEMQMGGYLWAKNLKSGVIWLFETAYFMEMITPIILTDDLKDKIQYDMEQIMKVDKADNVPKIDYIHSPNKTCINNDGKIWECKYCEYQDKCFELNPEHAQKVKKLNKPKRRKK